jgi:hypothetical protein
MIELLLTCTLSETDSMVSHWFRRINAHWAVVSGAEAPRVVLHRTGGLGD